MSDIYGSHNRMWFVCTGFTTRRVPSNVMHQVSVRQGVYSCDSTFVGDANRSRTSDSLSLCFWAVSITWSFCLPVWSSQANGADPADDDLLATAASYCASIATRLANKRSTESSKWLEKVRLASWR